MGSLYWGFVPFLIESFPYDCTELGTYSQLHDWRKAVLKKGDASSSLVASVPDQVRPLGWKLWLGGGVLGFTRVVSCVSARRLTQESHWKQRLTGFSAA